MINTGDLHIEDEIRPLFDFTFNHLSGKAVSDILTEPLGLNISNNIQAAGIKRFYCQPGTIKRIFFFKV